MQKTVNLSNPLGQCRDGTKLPSCRLDTIFTTCPRWRLRPGRWTMKGILLQLFMVPTRVSPGWWWRWTSVPRRYQHSYGRRPRYFQVAYSAGRVMPPDHASRCTRAHSSLTCSKVHKIVRGAYTSGKGRSHGVHHPRFRLQAARTERVAAVCDRLVVDARTAAKPSVLQWSFGSV